MIFHIIVGQRKVSYPGEYGPEALEVMDDDAMGDNGEWLINKMDEYRNTGEFDYLSIIQIGVPDKDIRAQLFPQVKLLRGKVL